MIRAPIVIGAILAGASEDQITALSEYGERVGLAFQIADDILDITSTSEELGKTAGKDVRARKATYPSIHGIAASEARARQLVEEAVGIVSRLDAETERLKEVAEFIIARRS
jgi:geranylgeranyl diphosphate synthase type II